jgi:uncharacterized membrane protein YgcG
MTAVMRAVSQQAGPKILRIGVVQAGKVIDERLIKQRTHVTIGPSEKSMFVVPSRKIPPSFKLFELIGNDYHLNYLDGMGGRVALKTGISDLAALSAQAKIVNEKGVKFSRVRLTDDSRGKVVIGETTFLFQFVVPPPVQPKPQLPMSVRKGMAGDIDWFTTIVAAFSFLLHFFVVALVYSDWMDPVQPDEDAVVNALVESVKSLPPPPPAEKQKSDANTEATAKSTAETEGPKVATNTGNPNPGKGGGPGKGGENKGDGKAAVDAKAAELANALNDLDVATVGAFGAGGPAIDNVLGSGEVPAGMLDDAGRSESGAGSGDPSGLKGLGGSGKGGTGSLGGGGQGDLSTKGERGGSGDGGGATSEGKTKEVKGPTGDASVGGAGVAGGAVANASAVVARMKGRFRACYQSGLNSNPDMAGSVVLVAKIGPNGEVQGVSGGGGSLGPIIGCLKSVVQSGGFSPPDGGSAVISIPITFVKQ